MVTPDGKTLGQVSALESTIPTLEQLGNLISAANAAELYAVHKVVPKLERLAEAFAGNPAEQMTTLKEFDVDEGLKRLENLVEEQRAEFDALDFIGQSQFASGRALWGSEEFHSNVLAWLLDPGQSHGYGDHFLKHFLLSAGLGLAGCSVDWSATEIVREWVHTVDGQQGYLDILILNEDERVLCAVENKVFSSEHSGQLTRYRKALESGFPDFTRHYVFLTPGRTLPSREEERMHWTSLGYTLIVDIVQRMVENNDRSINEVIDAFLRQYATTLRRNIMPETSVSQLARKIYLEHREAVELIVANRPNWVSEAKQWLKEAVAQQTEWVLDVEDRDFVRFRAREWDQYEATKSGSGWAPQSNALFLFQFRFYSDRPWLDLGLSPKNEVNNRLWEKLFDTVRQHPKLFEPRPSRNPGWMYLHEEDYILDAADYGVGWDDGTTRTKLEKWVEDFAANQFPAMNEVIVGCLREYEADQQT